MARAALRRLALVAHDATFEEAELRGERVWVGKRGPRPHEPCM